MHVPADFAVKYSLIISHVCFNILKIFLKEINLFILLIKFFYVFKSF